MPSGFFNPKVYLMNMYPSPIVTVFSGILQPSDKSSSSTCHVHIGKVNIKVLTSHNFNHVHSGKLTWQGKRHETTRCPTGNFCLQMVEIPSPMYFLWVFQWMWNIISWWPLYNSSVINHLKSVNSPRCLAYNNSDFNHLELGEEWPQL